MRTENVTEERKQLAEAWATLDELIAGFEPHINADDCDFRSGFFRCPSGRPMTRLEIAARFERIAERAKLAAAMARQSADDEARAK